MGISLGAEGECKGSGGWFRRVSGDVRLMARRRRRTNNEGIFVFALMVIMRKDRIDENKAYYWRTSRFGIRVSVHAGGERASQESEESYVRIRKVFDGEPKEHQMLDQFQSMGELLAVPAEPQCPNRDRHPLIAVQVFQSPREKLFPSSLVA